MMAHTFIRLSIAALAAGLVANPQTHSQVTTLPEPTTQNAHGTFEVKIAPQQPDNRESETAKLGRMSIDKHFAGDLVGTSTGEMLTGGVVDGSGVYVAIERVNGALQGKRGSFVLYHTGLMTRGRPQLTVLVAPDSGTGELTGLSGSMTIRIENGKHFYDFEYAIAAGK